MQLNLDFSAEAIAATTTGWAIGDLVVNNWPCPLKAMTTGHRGIYANDFESEFCYNYMAECSVVSILPDQRIILKNTRYLGIENHNGLTIVDSDYIEKSNWR